MEEIELLLREGYGLWFGPSKKRFLHRKAEERMKALGESSLESYISRLSLDPDERDIFVDTCTVGETYFFREPQTLYLLSDKLIPGLVLAKQKEGRPKSIRLLSTGCASGEEVYSATMLIHAAGFAEEGFQATGIDISKRALLRAREALYSPNSFRSLDTRGESLIERYTTHTGIRKRVADCIRELVTFKRKNLLEGLGGLKHFDVILCRNTMMYIDPARRDSVMEGFRTALSPGGVLLLGSSDSLGGTYGRFTRKPGPVPVYQRSST